VFLLIKLILLPVWLPFKIIAEMAEHSSHRRHYKRRRHYVRTVWMPGKAGLVRWTTDIMCSVRAAEQTPTQRFVVAPMAVLAVIVAWLVWCTPGCCGGWSWPWPCHYCCLR